VNRNVWHNKKLIIIGVVAVVVLTGVLGGVAMANADDQTATPDQPATLNDSAVSANISALLDRIATIYQDKTGQTLDTQALLDSLKQAQTDIQNERIDNFLDKLVENGKINADEAQQYKDWLAARPDVDVPGLGAPYGPGPGGLFRDRIQTEHPFGKIFRFFHGPNDNTTTTTTPDGA
jgi:hypothetical protein